MIVLFCFVLKEETQACNLAIINQSNDIVLYSRDIPIIVPHCFIYFNYFYFIVFI